jgi:hypothetical protein
MNDFAEEKPPALQREHPTFQRQHFFYWSSFPSWIWIRIPSPDRGLRTRMNTDPVRFRNAIFNPIRFDLIGCFSASLIY